MLVMLVLLVVREEGWMVPVLPALAAVEASMEERSGFGDEERCGAGEVGVVPDDAGPARLRAEPDAEEDEA